MRTILSILFIAALTGSLQANDLVWHKGSIVTNDSEVLVGDVARTSFDLLLYKNSDGNVASYPAHKVSSFRYYDQAENINRAFVSVASHSMMGKTYKYYERVVYGRISVLRIQKMFTPTINEKDADLYDFYIEDEKKVCSIKQFRKKYFDMIREELDNRLIAYRHLDPNTKHGAVSLIVLYNKSVPTLLSKAI
jgi:hypothetical protein